MKQLIGHDIGTYAFDHTAGTVTISGVTLTQEQILLITDTTAGTTIYQFNGGTTLGGSYVGGTGVLTLDYNTSALADADKLLIYVDVPGVVNTIKGAGTAGSPDTGVVSVQGVLSGTPVPVSGTVGISNIVQTVTGTQWTSSTALNTLQYPTGTSTIGASLNATEILIQLDQSSGTFSTGAVTFQGSYDSVNWISIPPAQIVNPQTMQPINGASSVYTFVTNTQAAFLIHVLGFQQIRLNLTTQITTTGTVTPYWTILSQTSLQSAMTTSTSLTGNNRVPASMVLVGGVYGGTPVTSPLLLNVNGALKVSVLGNASNTLDVAQGGGTAATNALQVAGVYNSSAPTLTTGQGGAFQLDSSGNLKVTGTVSVVGTLTHDNAAPSSNNIGVLPAIANALPPTFVEGDQVLLSTDLAGNLRVNATVTPASAALFPSPQVVGVVYDSSGTSHTLYQVNFSGITATATKVAASGSTSVYVYAFKYSVNGTVNVQLQSHTTTTNSTGLDYFVVNQGAVYPWNPGAWMATTAGEGLDVYLSAAIATSGCITYAQY